MNKFNAVVWDSFQAKNNETLAFDFYIHKLFLERDHLRNTSSNCLLCRVVKYQYPQLQFTRKQSTRRPQNAFSLVPNPKFICWKEMFLPLEKTHTKWRNLLYVCFGTFTSLCNSHHHLSPKFFTFLNWNCSWHLAISFLTLWIWIF